MSDYDETDPEKIREQIAEEIPDAKMGAFVYVDGDGTMTEGKFFVRDAYADEPDPQPLGDMLETMDRLMDLADEFKDEITRGIQGGVDDDV